ncbi:MAG TPA: L,D-transpeptidase [Pseudolabrys sp.]
MRLHRLALSVTAALVALAITQSARANIMIIIDKSAQQMTVTVNGEERYAWPVSTGREGYDTPSGEFQPFRMERDHFSREWDDAPMPNSIFFTQIGHAIHGTFEARNLGRPVSHGCVRLSTQNAATLYALVKDEGVFNTRVRLVGDAPKASDQPVARQNRNNGTERYAARSRDSDRDAGDARGNGDDRAYARNNDDDEAAAPNPPPQRTRQRGWRDTRSYYYRDPFFQRRYYGRGLFPFGW